MPDPIRLGVISFAHGHVIRYCQVIADYDDAEVVAGWDEDHDRGQMHAAEFGLDWMPDLDQMLARDDIDAVFVTSPTNRHAEHVIAAAEAGKHVLLQKPMALTLEDCDAIIDIIERTGVKFSMCYQMRGDPINQKMKALIDEGRGGQYRGHPPSPRHPGSAHAGICAVWQLAHGSGSEYGHVHGRRLARGRLVLLDARASGQRDGGDRQYRNQCGAR